MEEGTPFGYATEHQVVRGLKRVRPGQETEMEVQSGGVLEVLFIRGSGALNIKPDTTWRRQCIEVAPTRKLDA